MRTFRRLCVTGAVLLTLSACAAPNGPSGQSGVTVPVTPEFATATMRLTGGIAPTYEARWRVVRRDGRVYLCGAGVRSARVLSPAVTAALRATTLEINGALAASDIRFFTDLPARTALTGAQAACRDVGAAPAGTIDAVLRLGGRD